MNKVCTKMFREFAQKSGIRGFTYAETNNKWNKLMWYGIMLVCVGMTIYDVSGTIRYFMSFPTTTKVMLVNNHSIILGSPTLSISYTNTIGNLNEYRNGSKKDIYELLESVKRYYVEGFNISTTQQLDVELVQTAISLVVAVVSSVTRAEHYIAAEDNSYDFGWGYVDSYATMENETYVIHNVGSDQVEFANSWLAENNISVRRSAVVSVRLLCQLFRFIVSHHKRVKQNCDVIKPSWIGAQPGNDASWYDELFSFQIPSIMFTFGSSFGETSITMKRPLMFSADSPGYPVYIKLDFSGDPTLLKNTLNVVYQPVDTTGWIIATVAAQYKQINTLRSPCSAKDHFSLCKFNRRRQAIEDFCNCSPLDLTENSPIKRECSVELLKNSTNKNCTNRSTGYLFAQPSRNCYQKCDRPAMWFTQGRDDFYRKTNETFIGVYVDVFNYPVFEEIPLLEPKQILGSLGGNLSLYLGANFMLLYYTVFYWVTSLFGRVIKKQSVSKKTHKMTRTLKLLKLREH